MLHVKHEDGNINLSYQPNGQPHRGFSIPDRHVKELLVGIQAIHDKLNAKKEAPKVKEETKAERKARLKAEKEAQEKNEEQDSISDFHVDSIEE